MKTLTNQVIQTPTCVISKNSPTYFIADIAANHDGSLDRAINLIRLAAESGANAAKFQNFKAETIVSNRGFAELGGKLAHQSKWKKDVVQVYREASIPLDWTDSLIKACKENNIDYFKFYGRDIETLLSKTKIAHSKRVFCKSEDEKKKLTIKDINKGLETFLKNENFKKRKEEESMNRIISSIYV